jgi:hypothetical protein
VGDAVVYTQREGSAVLPATVESVNHPGSDEGGAALVTYTIDISGRKRETTQVCLCDRRVLSYDYRAVRGALGHGARDSPHPDLLSGRCSGQRAS